MDPGDVIVGLRGSYRIEARHGQGAFGITYRGVDEASRAPVMVKELRVERLDDWKALELFEREAEVLSSLSHPNIPAFRDFFAHGGPAPLAASAMSSYEGATRLSLALVQQFIDGATLQHRFDRGERLSPAETERVLRALLAALRYLHEREPPLVHRDIKPGNVILTPDGRPYLVDFGAIQNRLRRLDSVGSTIVGTMGYMPFEQIRGRAGPASDLYALGMTMLVSLTAKAPEELPVDESTGKVGVDRVVPRDTPRALRGVLDAMTEVLVGQRVQTAAEVLVRLDAPAATPTTRVTNDEGARRVADGASKADAPAGDRPQREPRMPRINVAIIAPALAVAIGIAAVVARNAPSHSPSRTPSPRPAGDTLLGTVLSNGYQTIDVPYATADARFDAMAPPAWVARVATTWRRDAQLNGMWLGEVDREGFANVSGHVEYQYYSSGDTLVVGLDIVSGAVRVSAKKVAMGRPMGPIACSLRRALDTVAAAGRLPTQPTYVVTLGDDLAVAPRWEIQLDKVKVVAAVDPTSCVILR